MSEQTQTKTQKADIIPLPVVAGIIMAAVSAVIVGFSFVVIKHWPQPCSVVPAYDFSGGAWWGIIVGGICGFIIGFLTDDIHFTEPNK